MYVNNCHWSAQYLEKWWILYYLTKQVTKNKPQQNITDKKENNWT